MAAFITISVGPDVETAEPILVSDDPAIIGAAIEALLDRISWRRSRATPQSQSD
jgi:hypothetical protein